MKEHVMQILSKIMKYGFTISCIVILLTGLHLEPTKIAYVLCGSIWAVLFLGIASFAISSGYWFGRIGAMRSVYHKKENTTES